MLIILKLFVFYFSLAPSLAHNWHSVNTTRMNEWMNILSVVSLRGKTCSFNLPIFQEVHTVILNIISWRFQNKKLPAVTGLSFPSPACPHSTSAIYICFSNWLLLAIGAVWDLGILSDFELQFRVIGLFFLACDFIQNIHVLTAL